MTWENALAMFLVMLTVQIPLLIAAVVAYFRGKAAALKVVQKVEAVAAVAEAQASKLDSVSVKLDENTALTAEAMDKTDGNTDKLDQITKQTNGDLDRIKAEVHGLAKGHEAAKQEVVDTRHDLLGVMGATVNALNILLLKQGLPAVKLPARAKELKRPGDAAERGGP